MTDLNASASEFCGKVAVVTGGGSGIGRAIATLLSQAGASVAVVDLTVPSAESEIDEDFPGAKVHVMRIGGDVSRAEAIHAALQGVRDRFGRLDAAFNCAGVEGDLASLIESTEANWDRVISVNLKGVWNCMRAQIPLMLESGGGSIVNIASIAGVVAQPGASAYCASKHGVLGLTKVAALEYIGKKIRINAVCPGPVNTPMMGRLARSDPRLAESLAHASPIGRLASAEEIARAALWLGSDAASYMVGATLMADGGVSLP